MFGCRGEKAEVPELLSESLNALGGPVRITWYLSPELSDAEELRATDRLIADLVSASEPGAPIISAVVRPPEPGERQPGSLLPIPATDNLGNTVFLWSALVIDWREHRIAIPDLWEPGWLSLDLTRALQDLAQGSPMSLGYLDGSPDGPQPPLALLSGRWNPSEWYPETSSPNNFDLLMIHEGPELDALGTPLIGILDNYVEQGGGVFVAATAALGAESSIIGEWAGNNASERVIYAESDTLFDPGYYRDLDTALLLAAGRIDLLAMMASDTEGIRTPGSRAAGSRLLKSAEMIRSGYAIHAEKVSQIGFSVEEANIFTLEKSDSDWYLISGDWRLPARSDRVGSFLRRLQNGSGEIWRVTENSGLLNHELYPTTSVELRQKNDKNITVDFAGERRAGGGAYFRSGGGVGLWPLIGSEEISPDARYWMERRLFPLTDSAIRVELRTDSKLYWRLHEEGGAYFLTDADGKRSLLDADYAGDFLGRLLRSEALTLAPAEEEDQSPLKLMIEESSGRRMEYRLGDDAGGRVVAESAVGILFVLDETLVSFILNGPEAPGP